MQAQKATGKPRSQAHQHILRGAPEPLSAHGIAALHPPDKAAAVALYYFSYNLVKIHGTLRTTPAMAAGVTDRLWEVSDLVALLEASERGLERAA